MKSKTMVQVLKQVLKVLIFVGNAKNKRVKLPGA